MNLAAVILLTILAIITRRKLRNSAETLSVAVALMQQSYYYNKSIGDETKANDIEHDFNTIVKSIRWVKLSVSAVRLVISYNMGMLAMITFSDHTSLATNTINILGTLLAVSNALAITILFQTSKWNRLADKFSKKYTSIN